MTLHETPWNKSRVMLLGRSEFIDLDEYLDVEPQSEKTNFSVVQSISGRVQTLYESRSDTLKIKQTAPDLERVKELQRLWRIMLSRGDRIEVIRDRSKYFHLYGDVFENDVIEDEYNRQKPQAGEYYQSYASGQYGLGSVGVDPANPVGTTRTNLIPNGDFIDPLADWTNSTSTLLAMGLSTYNRLTTTQGSQIKFSYLGSGTKSAYITFNSDSIQVKNFPAKGLTFSFWIRSDRHASTAVSNLVTVELIINGGSTYTVYQGTPTNVWSKKLVYVDLSSETATTTTTGHQLKFTFSNDLKNGPVYVTQLQAEHRRGASTFIPYSTVRTSLTGSKGSGYIKFLNGLHYKHQEPSWKNGDRWGFTVSMWFAPGFGSASNPGWEISSANNKLDFVRGVTTYAATITDGQYDGISLATEIQRAMRAADSGNSYTCSYDSATWKFTIAGTSTFSMPWTTGVNVATSIASTIGYTADDSGTNSYLADTANTGYFWLYHDGDSSSTGNQIPALSITATQTSISATASLDGGSTVTVTTTGVTWAAPTAKNITVSFRDWDGATSNSGTLTLYIDGSGSSSTHSGYGARQGESFWLGCSQTQTKACLGTFNNVRLDPVFINGTTYTINDYRDTDTPPDRLRNAWYCKALKPEPLVMFNDRDNCYMLQADLIEDRV